MLCRSVTNDCLDDLSRRPESIESGSWCIPHPSLLSIIQVIVYSIKNFKHFLTNQPHRECFYILNNRTDWFSEYSRLHFESGVRLGIGTFNLMISHMPSKVLKLLEFVGFSGDRQQGLRELKASTLLQNGLRRPLAVLIMLAYQCYVEHIFGMCIFIQTVIQLNHSINLGLGDGDMQCVDTCLDYGLSEHPDVCKSHINLYQYINHMRWIHHSMFNTKLIQGAFFLLFLGRKKQLTGQINEAIEALKRCISVQNEWKQFHNICHWELLWCYAYVLSVSVCAFHTTS